MDTQAGTAEPQGQTKEYTIIVNGRPRKVTEKKISYEEVVRLAYPEPKPDFEYIVTYAKGPDDKKEGTLTASESVHVKDSMVFNVRETTKS